MNREDLRVMSGDLATGCGKGILVGTDLYFAPMNVNGRFFHFSPLQTRFLWSLMKAHGNVAEACAACGWDEEQARRFFISRKWREYRDQLIASSAVMNGDLRAMWWNFTVDGMRGYREIWEGECEFCRARYALTAQEAAPYFTDEMVLAFVCRVCQKSVSLTYRREEFTPSREQVQCASEVGARVEPKRQHISHSFSEETFNFVPDTTETEVE